MCDYSAEPAWWVPSGIMASLDRLPLSAGLRGDLERWAEHFESSDYYASDDSLAASGLRYFATWAEELAFEQEGLELWRRVRAELPEGWDAGYHSEILGEDVWDPDDPRLLSALAEAAERLAGELSAAGSRSDQLTSGAPLVEAGGERHVFS
jgi:hypothetical protein